MPAILLEGGFYDSLTDIAVLHSNKRLTAVGEAIADGLAHFYQLKMKEIEIVLPARDYRLVTGTFKTRLAAENAAEVLRKQYGWTIYVKEA